MSVYSRIEMRNSLESGISVVDTTIEKWVYILDALHEHEMSDVAIMIRYGEINCALCDLYHGNCKACLILKRFDCVCGRTELYLQLMRNLNEYQKTLEDRYRYIIMDNVKNIIGLLSKLKDDRMNTL